MSVKLSVEVTISRAADEYGGRRSGGKFWVFLLSSILHANEPLPYSQQQHLPNLQPSISMTGRLSKLLPGCSKNIAPQLPSCIAEVPDLKNLESVVRMLKDKVGRESAIPA
jgi:hypothetical protein